MTRHLLLALAMNGAASTAVAQVPPPETTTAVPATEGTPWLTVRFHAGPNYNLMGDWRDGLSALQDQARQRGLSPSEGSCICMSWGSAALAHVTPRFAVGGEFEMLRDTRTFTVEDAIQLTGTSGRFAFRNESVVRATQAIAAFYPRAESRTHIQVGAGIGTGHTELSTPKSGATGRLNGPLLTMSVGTEARFWYVNAGWRFHRMRVRQDDVLDHAIDEARDVFGSTADVQQFVQQREVDFTGGWARIGLAFHLGRR